MKKPKQQDWFKRIVTGSCHWHASHWNGLNENQWNWQRMQYLPEILLVGSKANIFSIRSRADGWTWGKALARDCRGWRGSCAMYLFASSFRTKPRSDSVGVPKSWENNNADISIHAVEYLLYMFSFISWSYRYLYTFYFSSNRSYVFFLPSLMLSLEGMEEVFKPETTPGLK